MDFIDPAKRRAHQIRLIVGYVLIFFAIVLSTLILLYQTYGYGFGANGQVVQDGLVFISSAPNPASIYLNGVLNSATTNARLDLPAGEYTVKLVRNGYRSWQRAVGVEGGSVERFDYPFFFPTTLQTNVVRNYSAQPSLVLQSPDRRWLLVQQPGSLTKFDEFDLANPKQIVSSEVDLPSNVLTSATGAEQLSLVSWSTDNQHILLRHTYPGGSEYVVMDRQTPAQSVNLTKTLNLSPTTQPAFDNNHYDQYFLFDTAAQTLTAASLSTPTPTPLLEHVLAYKSYGGNIFLYVTDNGAPKGKIFVKLLQNNTTYTLQKLAANAATYDLNLTQYNGDWYVVDGDSSENKAYVYEDPATVLSSNSGMPLVPIQILKVDKPTFVDFSANAQFVFAEGGQQISVFDAQNDKGYTYTISDPIGSGQHATWMDGDRLIVTTSGMVHVFDYDDANQQTLQPIVPGTPVYFDQSYKWAFEIAPTTTASQAATTPFTLSRTALRIPADQ